MTRPTWRGITQTSDGCSPKMIQHEDARQHCPLVTTSNPPKREGSHPGVPACHLKKRIRDYRRVSPQLSSVDAELVYHIIPASAEDLPE